MHQALYRKYRPQVFSDVHGQEHITSILQNEAKNNSFSHAYLFSGSRGTGKTTCAKILAKSVNCLNLKDGNPCGECENCRAIDLGTTTDMLEMDAATNTGVDYIRDLRDNVLYTPSMLKKRVYIIDEAHMLSDSAFNALLKTIEEPPEHVLFIFATTEQHKIPATIISRCQRFEFRRISMESLVKRLLYIAKCESIDLTEEGARVISKVAEGGMRDAISLMELCAGAHTKITPEHVNKILGTSSYEKMANVVKSIAKKEYSKLFDAINEVVISSKDILVFFSDLTSFYRDMMVVKSSGDASFFELPEGEKRLLLDSASEFNMATLIYHASLLDSAYTNMMRNPTQKRLMAEITLMKMCDPKLTDSTDALLARIAILEDKIALLSRGALPIERVEVAETALTETQKQEIKQDEVKKPQSSTSEVKKYLEIDAWDEVVSKIRETNSMLASFIVKVHTRYCPQDRQYYIQADNEVSQNILTNNKQAIFDAMLISEVDISSPAQIQIFTNKKQAPKENGLEEF